MVAFGHLFFLVVWMGLKTDGTWAFAWCFALLWVLRASIIVDGYPVLWGAIGWRVWVVLDGIALVRDTFNETSFGLFWVGCVGAVVVGP